VFVKQHLSVLDGLRGTAALSVVVFHFQALSSGMEHPDGLWLRHAYLAVDFFFCLSGYVIGYAYDNQRERLGIRGFVAARLIRLHPMVVFGVALGVASYLLDPFNHTGHAQPWLQSQQAPLLKVLLGAIGEIFMLPSAPLPNRVGAYFPLNTPAWSLTCEYVASFVFAVTLWRARKGTLLLVTVIAAFALTIAAFHAGTVSWGAERGQMIYGLIRVSFSFSMGLLLFRSRIQLKAPFASYATLSVVLLALFFFPTHGNVQTGDVPFTWLYDLAAVLVVFPLIVLLGASASTSGLSGRVCAFFGRISYPIYMIHYAFIMVFANYVWTRTVTRAALTWLIAISTVAVIGFSYVILALYDEPVRRRLARATRSFHGSGDQTTVKASAIKAGLTKLPLT
jgi:peptidoglycan/LPS O-acetylase OafA/YrhL